MVKAFSYVGLVTVGMAMAVFALSGVSPSFSLPKLPDLPPMPDMGRFENGVEKGAAKLMATASEYLSGDIEIKFPVGGVVDEKAGWAASGEAALGADLRDAISGGANGAATLRGANGAKILFVGDIMLDRGVARRAELSSIDAIFAGVSDLFRQADAVVGNLEGTITASTSVSMNNSGILRFTFDQKFAPFLKDAGFTAFSLANNHSYDFGMTGFKDTKDVLSLVGIPSFGSALNIGELSAKIAVGDRNDLVCFVGYHDLYDPDPASALAETKKLDVDPECPNLVAFVHGGEEYEQAPNARQRKLARQFIDAGADLVIGAHPHVVQPVEVYNGRAIFYSLGNFVFDQDFSFETMHGMAVMAELGRGEGHSGQVFGESSSFTRFMLIPVEIKGGTVSVLPEGETRDKLLRFAVGKQTDAEVAAMIRGTGGFEVGR